MQNLLDTPVQPSPTENLSVDENAYSAAYDAVKDELAAMSESDLESINLDIQSATTTVLGALPEVHLLRDAMVKTLVDVDIARIDRLEVYASATLYLHSVFSTTVAAASTLAPLGDEATQLRDSFVADAQALVQRGLLEASVVNDRPRGPGYKALSFELLSLALRLRAAWPRIAGRSALAFEEFGKAEALAMRIQRLVGLREQAGPARSAAVTLERQKAYTLFIRAYDEARRAVTYLRWKEDDADRVLPSLWAGRGGRKRETPPSDRSPSSPSTPTSAPDAPTSAFPAFDPRDPANNPFLPT